MLLLCFAHDLPGQLFTVTLAVRHRGVDEVEPKLDGASKRAQGLVVIAAQPLLAADAPGAVSDLADFDVGAAEFSIVHLMLTGRENLIAIEAALVSQVSTHPRKVESPQWLRNRRTGSALCQQRNCAGSYRRPGSDLLDSIPAAAANVGRTFRADLEKSQHRARCLRRAAHLGGDLEDALFLQGFVTAQDRLWQMDALRRLAGGELSEVVGSAALETDKESRRLRMRRMAEEHYRALTPADRAVLSAYARGVNFFIQTILTGFRSVHHIALRSRPWSVVDSLLVGLQMYRNLTTT